eukprot:5049353-Pyramimonas_sp.AAC.1
MSSIRTHCLKTTMPAIYEHVHPTRVLPTGSQNWWNCEGQQHPFKRSLKHVEDTQKTTSV